MSGPIIGIILDSEDSGGYSKLPWYALRENYVHVLAEQGAIPFLLPHEMALADAYLERIDGLLIPGGDFDIDPVHFGVNTRHETVVTKDQRTAFELLMTREAHRRDMPLLGICGGQQLLNVALGGTLIQHIPDEVEGALAHEQPNPRDEPGHEVEVAEGSLLHRVTGARSLAVNSAHHQAVREVSGKVIVDARAPDGVIEGIEDPTRRFCLGVQWHPEYLVSEGDSKIFAAFVTAAAKR
ncbi:MAG: gamma-glutamyl-gamma-aminobutyrate hydrolase family protein [Alphaproteobacteria bacterium]